MRYARNTEVTQEIGVRESLGESVEGSAMEPQPQRRRGRERRVELLVGACPWRVQPRRSGSGEDSPAGLCPWRVQPLGQSPAGEEAVL